MRDNIYKIISLYKRVKNNYSEFEFYNKFCNNMFPFSYFMWKLNEKDTDNLKKPYNSARLARLFIKKYGRNKDNSSLKEFYDKHNPIFSFEEFLIEYKRQKSK